MEMQMTDGRVVGDVVDNEGVIMCDRCPEERAIARYVWSWGEEGFCSHKGKFLLDQQAKNNKQSISYLPLVQAVPEPLKRDERTRLIAEKISAESELTEVLERNARLYAQNTEIGSQLQNLKVRDAEAGRQIQDLKIELAETQAQLTQEAVTKGKLSVELQKANELLAAGPGEEQAQIAELNKLVSSLQTKELELASKVDDLSSENQVLKTRLGSYYEDAWRAAEPDSPDRSLIEAEMRKLGIPHTVG